jgi:transposase-like protein
MSAELRPPKWTGVLHVDEKMASVRGGQQWWYLAVDGSGDVVDFRGVKELNVNEAMAFLEDVKRLSGNWWAIVTDLDTPLTMAVKRVFPGKPHQYCLKHALSAIETSIGYMQIHRERRMIKGTLRDRFERLRSSRGGRQERARQAFLRHWKETRSLSGHYDRVTLLRDECYGILYAKDEEEALGRLAQLRRAKIYPAEKLTKTVSFFERHWDRLMLHHRMRGIPRTNNMAENVNKQVERRLKTIEAFQHCSTALSYMNLLIAYLRCKPYTDCKKIRKHLNGKSRLEAAGVKNLSKDWMKTCLKSTKNTNR